MLKFGRLLNTRQCKPKILSTIFLFQFRTIITSSDHNYFTRDKNRANLNHHLEINFSTKVATKSRSRLTAPIKLTERAAERIRELLSLKNNAIGVRIGVKRRGCNGYSYTMNYVFDGDVDSFKDEIVACHGVKVFVDPKAVFFIVGTEMDFIETDIASEFTFTNPNSKGECGCGESFNV